MIGDIVFSDVRDYTSPCSLSEFLSQWGVKESKSIFPFNYYRTIESIVINTSFPMYEAFYSELKQMSCDLNEYNIAKAEFESRQKLPKTHPNHMETMKQWLEYYNTLDVVPLRDGIDRMFNEYHKLFKLDPFNYWSLPSLAYK